MLTRIEFYISLIVVLAIFFFVHAYSFSVFQEHSRTSTIVMKQYLEDSKKSKEETKFIKEKLAQREQFGSENRYMICNNTMLLMELRNEIKNLPPIKWKDPFNCKEILKHAP